MENSTQHARGRWIRHWLRREIRAWTGETPEDESPALAATLRKMVEESRECLVTVDANGKIQEASRPAVTLLFSGWGQKNETLLEELFTVNAREGVAEWRERFLRRLSANSAESRGPRAPALEAALDRGEMVRMHLRCEIPVGDGRGPKWLLSFEDPSAEKARHEA